MAGLTQGGRPDAALAFEPVGGRTGPMEVQTVSPRNGTTTRIIKITRNLSPARSNYTAIALANKVENEIFCDFFHLNTHRFGLLATGPQAHVRRRIGDGAAMVIDGDRALPG